MINNKTVYGVGFITKGEYEPKFHKQIYVSWNSMLGRCYKESYQIRNPNYKECFVDKKWFSFKSFVIDYLQMVGSENGWQLDKDILIKGNKIYSNETCCLVPKIINGLFINCNSSSKELPIGVVGCDSFKNPYQAFCRIKGKRTYLGNFNNLVSAFEAYKIAKESEIKRIADLHKESIDIKVYLALINYKVEIND